MLSQNLHLGFKVYTTIKHGEQHSLKQLVKQISILLAGKQYCLASIQHRSSIRKVVAGHSK